MHDHIGPDTAGGQHASGSGAFDDEDLRRRLAELPRNPARVSDAGWDWIGRQLLALAERDGHRSRDHSSEYREAFICAAVECLQLRRDTVLTAHRPWGLVIAHSRFAAQAAVNAEACGGLTGRDPVTHHTRFADLPLVVSLDALVDAGHQWPAG